MIWLLTFLRVSFFMIPSYVIYVNKIFCFFNIYFTLSNKYCLLSKLKPVVFTIFSINLGLPYAWFPVLLSE